MIKSVLIALMCLILSSCAVNRFSGIYKNALRDKTVITLTREENYQELQYRVMSYFQGRGYKKIVFIDRKQNLLVLEKQGDFDLTCQVIVKYTKMTDGDHIRIDIVRASDDLVTNNMVSYDIQKILEEIKNK